MKDHLEVNNNFSKILRQFPKITYAGNKALRTKAKRVNFKDGVRIGKRLVAVLKKYKIMTGRGRGLAAPQIGIAKTVFVTFLDDTFEIYINPRIIRRSKEKNLYRESCISSATLSADVVRPRKITLIYSDLRGMRKEIIAEGFLARLLQHEHDHLHGILSIDISEPGSIEYTTKKFTREKLRVVRP